MTIAGARVLVVGGSAGIGREVGVQAARAGASVAFAARRKDRLDDAVEAAGGGFAVQLDVTDAAAVVAGVAEATAKLGGDIDVLVYASGWANLSTLAEETEEHWHRMLATNVVGATSVVRAVLPSLSSDALLVFLTSTSTERRLWALNAYGATKAALERYLDGLKDERPNLRIMRLRIGSTIGTDFGADFDGAVLTEAMARWVTSGNHTARVMTVPAMASVALGVFSLLRAHTDVDVPEFHLDPTGGIVTLPPTQDAIAQAYSTLDVATDA